MLQIQMVFRNQYSLLQKTVILSLAMSFILFGMPKSKNISHAKFSTKKTQLKSQLQSDTCCKDCVNENCTCCSHHEKSSSSKPVKCACNVSKDMADKPLTPPGNIKPAENLFSQVTAATPFNSISKDLFSLILKSPTEYFFSLKFLGCTVLRI